MPKHVYIAAPPPEIERARSAARVLSRAGFTIESSWHNVDATVAKERVLGTSERRRIAETCREEVRRADYMLAFYDPAARTEHVIEIGMALGVLMPMAIVRLDRGERDCVFLSADDVRVFPADTLASEVAIWFGEGK